ncbi:unnamed protein product [Rotaria sordida]|uniref:Uncharacterized protein n=1 Tax=Rotaria sordida TaxID=392033 RepID=A0A819GFZ8_9BILA|nr:unnamed protein product [Rotaria sordida]CAF3881313.1 unnamed protein product [Rotaria sordida]
MSSSSSTIPKFERIRKRQLSPDQAHIQIQTKKSSMFSKTLLTHDDYENIYKNMTILFVVITTGRLLDYTEASCCNGHYKIVEGETIIKAEGSIGTVGYKNIRKFKSINNSINIIFIYLPTIMDYDLTVDNLRYLQDEKLENKIDFIIFGSYAQDMTKEKIIQSNLTYKEYVDKYLVSLDSVARYLKTFSKQQQHQKREQLFWISPYPFKPDMSHEETCEFERINKEIDNIMKLNMYQKYDRFDLFVRRPDLVITRISHFSLHGVREISDSIARTIGQQMNRSFTPAIPFPSTPLTKKEQQ